jgi:hypothetical protein
VPADACKYTAQHASDLGKHVVLWEMPLPSQLQQLKSTAEAHAVHSSNGQQQVLDVYPGNNCSTSALKRTYPLLSDTLAGASPIKEPGLEAPPAPADDELDPPMPLISFASFLVALLKKRFLSPDSWLLEAARTSGCCGS